jgi:aryl-alcohol dehydrogenase-like predicted oxidoreductase
VLQSFADAGARVVDTARVYGESEAVLGQLMASLGNREQLFLATKTPMGGDVADGDAVLEESFRRLRTDRVDLVQVHNFHGAEQLLPVLRAWKKAGRIRYVGVTTAMAAQYPLMKAALQAGALDFIQVNYSLGDRAAEAEILPLARDKGVAVLANMPFGGRRANLLPKLAAKPLPGWAKDIGAQSWAQVLLKYAISHPVVTCAIPGATKVTHVQDNLAAARGPLPDAALRRRMEEDWAKA